MIVHCPSCSTRYHHEAAPESLLASAHCSECDEIFPLETPRRRYLIVPTGGSVRKSIGMDDPGLAEQIHGGRPERAASAVLSHASHSAPIAEAQPTACPLVESDGDRPHLEPLDSARGAVAEFGAEPRGSADPAGSTETSARWTPAAEFEGQARIEPEGQARTEKRAALSETVVVVGPACAGAGLTYYLAGAAGSPWVSLALGGVLGLLVGWGCLRWMRRED